MQAAEINLAYSNSHIYNYKKIIQLENIGNVGKARLLDLMQEHHIECVIYTQKIKESWLIL